MKSPPFPTLRLNKEPTGHARRFYTPKQASCYFLAIIEALQMPTPADTTASHCISLYYSTGPASQHSSTLTEISAGIC